MKHGWGGSVETLCLEEGGPLRTSRCLSEARNGRRARKVDERTGEQGQ